MTRSRTETVELRANLMQAEHRFLSVTLRGTLAERQLAEAEYRAAYEKVYGPLSEHKLSRR